MKLVLLLTSFGVFVSTLCSAAIKNNVAKRENISICLRSALTASNPYERDNRKIKCVEKNKLLLSLDKCTNIAQGLEYSTNEDNMRFFCLEEISSSRNLTFPQCFQVAQEMEFSENSENAKWSCFKKFENKINKRQCLKIAHSLLLSTHRDQVSNFCLRELNKN